MNIFQIFLKEENKQGIFYMKMYDSNNKPLILFATPPTLDQLCAITIRLLNSTQTAARFQPQVIKCRYVDLS